MILRCEHCHQYWASNAARGDGHHFLWITRYCPWCIARMGEVLR